MSIFRTTAGSQKCTELIVSSLWIHANLDGTDHETQVMIHHTLATQIEKIQSTETESLINLVRANFLQQTTNRQANPPSMPIGANALCKAVSENREDRVRYLLASGHPVDDISTSGFERVPPAVHLAIGYSREFITRFLLSKGAKGCCQDGERTAIISVIINSRMFPQTKAEFVKRLLRNGAPGGEPDTVLGVTALRLALDCGISQVFRVLLHTLGYEEGLLIHALYMGKSEEVRMMLQCQIRKSEIGMAVFAARQ